MTEDDSDLPMEFADLLGKRIGNFVLSSPLGRGGMGVVFVAEHPALSRKVAVKFLSRSLAAVPDMATRFLQEARTAASLRHPNIVDIFDFGELEGNPYYVMELLEGEDLGTVIHRGGQFSVDDVTQYLVPISAALDVAHEKGVVHRDLKPANVFVLSGSPFRLKLMDFGIAKVLDSRAQPTRTQTGQVLGTPSHMAPEQAMGNVRLICPQTDLYSLGVILYEMLTGVPIFEHESAVMLMSMHARDPFVSIRDLAPGTPDRVVRIVEKCLNKAPKDRPASAGEVAREFLESLGAAPETVERHDEEPERITRSRDILISDIPAKALAETLLAVAPAPAPAVAPPAPAVALAPPASAPAVAPPAPAPAPKPAPPAVTIAAASLPATRRAGAPPPSPAASNAVRAPLISDSSTEEGDAAAEDAPLSEAEQSTVKHLLLRMQRKGDFPSFVQNISAVSRHADVRSAASAGQLGETILRDYALTAKLLRLVNSSYYERYGKKISKVSRAVVVLGFERVRSVALSVAIHKNPGNKAHAKELAELSINSLVSGEIARSIAPTVGLDDGEEAMVCAMFRNLGRHLVVYYLPEDYDKIRHLMNANGASLEVAEKAILGVSSRKLGMGVAKTWGLSARIAESMIAANPNVRANSEGDRLRAVSSFSNDLCETVASTSVDRLDLAIEKVLAHYKVMLPVRPAHVNAMLGSVQKTFKERYSTLLGLDVENSEFFLRANELAPAAGGAPPEPTPVQPPTPTLAGQKSVDARTQALESSLKKIEGMLSGPYEPSEAMRVVLKAFVSGFGFRRALVLAPGGERGSLRVQAAFGEDAKMLEEEFSVTLASSLTTDVFTSAYQASKDIVILDSFDKKNTARIPRNYYEMIGSAVLVIYACSAAGTTRLLVADADSVNAVPSPDNMVYVEKFRELVSRKTLAPSILMAKAIRPGGRPR